MIDSPHSRNRLFEMSWYRRPRLPTAPMQQLSNSAQPKATVPQQEAASLQMYCLVPAPKKPANKGTDASGASPRAQTYLSLSLRSSPSCAGIALVELITAFFVLTLGLFGAIRMYHFCLDKTRAVHEAKTVMRALNNEIEHLRALPFADLENGQATSFRSETPGVEALVNASTTVAIEDYASPGAQPAPVAGVSDKRSPMPGLKRATVRIRWTGENGRTITKELVTLIADKG